MQFSDFSSADVAFISLHLTLPLLALLLGGPHHNLSGFVATAKSPISMKKLATNKEMKSEWMLSTARHF